MDTNYKLVHSVDPTKCRAKIKEKFAKLTLSSHKKKQQDAEMQRQIREQASRSNVSRNLLSDLMTDDESDDEKPRPQKPTENMLLRTDSSESASKKRLNITDTTNCSEVEEDFDKSTEMEPLLVSGMENTEEKAQFNNMIEKLSTRVSSLTVSSAAPITISSNEVSQIISTESQKMGHGQRFSDLLRMKKKTEPPTLISIPSSSECSDEAITISDSSDGDGDFEPNVTPTIARNIRQSQETGKADRMAAFLRDVRRNYGLPVDSPDREYERRRKEIASADTEPMTMDTDSRSAETAGQIAKADTESMSPDAENSIKQPIKTPQNVPVSKNLAMNDTEDMSYTLQSPPHYNPVMNVASELLEDSMYKSSTSIPDDSLTVAETSEEEVEENPEKERTQQTEKETESALRPSGSPSVQTSKESSLSTDHDPQFKINISAKIKIQIQVSQQLEESTTTSESTAHSSSNQSESDLTDEGPKSSAQKAKSRSMAIEEIANTSSERENSRTSIDREGRNDSQPVAERDVSNSPPEKDPPHSPPETDIPAKSPKPKEKSPVNFMTRAERLLNELYGDSWKTPDVMRSLKSTAQSKSTRTKVPHSADPDPDPVPLPDSDPVPLPDPSPVPIPDPEPEPASKDESNLGDFSIFRKNIPQDLDSTRLPFTPVSTFKVPKTLRTGSRSARRPGRIVEEPSPRKVSELEVTTKSGRQIHQRLQRIVDSDTESEGENASGDDKSWNLSKSDSETADEEEEEIKLKSTRKSPKISPAKPSTGRKGRRVLLDSDTESEGKTVSHDPNKSWNTSNKSDLENKSPAKGTRARGKVNSSRRKKNDDLVYLDLSKDEVEIQHNVSNSPPANHDEKFNRRLENILKSCKFEDKPKLEWTPSGKTKRKLFTANLNDDDDNLVAPFDSPKERQQYTNRDEESVSISGVLMPAKFEPFNKYLESVKTGHPIFKIQTPKTRPGNQGQKSIEGGRSPSVPKTPNSAFKEPKTIGDLCATPKDKYGFLKSLDVCVGKSLCHPDALHYRDNFRSKKDELANKLYEIYITKCFSRELDVPIQWNKKLTNTAGRCMNKKRLGERTCVIELSEKVLTSADRLRCTLIHELCHAATWILNGEGGHGATWKAWARKANQVFPELPKIGVCHQYDIEYKYTYKCTLCGAKSHAHSKSKKVENIRCSYCHGAIEVYLNKKDKEGNTIATPVREPTGFAKFVKDKYKEFKRPDLKHADVMKLLSNEFAAMKVGGK